MQRITPSERIGQQVSELLEDGLESEDNPLGALMQLSAQLVVQEALEGETTEQLGRGYYQHRDPDEPLKSYRNGYEEGLYRSRLMSFLRGKSDVLEKLAVEMYARDLSVQDIEDALRDTTGDPLLSRSAVSELSESLWEDYDAFWQRDLSSFEIEYLFIDAVYEGLREWGCSQGILCAWGILRNGNKILLHLALGSRESYQSCLEFIRNMVQRGLRAPVLVTTDGAPGLIRAVTEA